jgi:hypothetical protein
MGGGHAGNAAPENGDFRCHGNPVVTNGSEGDPG